MNNVFEIQCNDYNYRKALCRMLTNNGCYVRTFQRPGKDGKDEWWVEYFCPEEQGEEQWAVMWEAMQYGR